MATINYTPSRSDQSFDTLTDLVCGTENPEALHPLLALLESKGKINPRERAMIVRGHSFYHLGVTDESFDAWSADYGTLLDSELTRRESKFASWLV